MTRGSTDIHWTRAGPRVLADSRALLNGFVGPRQGKLFFMYLDGTPAVSGTTAPSLCQARCRRNYTTLRHAEGQSLLQVDWYARPHRRCQRHGVNILPFRAGRLCLLDRVHEGGEILEQGSVF